MPPRLIISGACLTYDVMRKLIILLFAPLLLHADVSIEEVEYKAGKGNPEAQYLLGVIYSNGSGVEKDDPKAFELYQTAGEVINGKKQIELYQQILAIDPNYSEVYNNLGVALYYEGRLDESVIVIKKSLDLKPNYAEAHNNLATGTGTAAVISEMTCSGVRPRRRIWGLMWIR